MQDAPDYFIPMVKRVWTMLMANAQADILEKGISPSYFATAQFAGEDSISIDAQAVRESLIFENDAAVDEILSPLTLSDESSTLALMEATKLLNASKPGLVVRCLMGAKSDKPGLTPEGEAFWERLTERQRIESSGAYVSWAVDFVSSDGKWFARASHIVSGKIIQRADLSYAPLVSTLEVLED